MTTVTVVGLGKIGLPLAVQFAGAGAQVIGADTNSAVVDQVNAGREPFPGEFDLQRRLTEVVAAGALRATADKFWIAAKVSENATGEHSLGAEGE